MTETCCSCRAETPCSTTGITHTYLNASPGCWARYGEVLAREYSDAQCFRVHGLTVDAYAIQHPGRESSQTTQSLNIHLASLYAYYHHQVKLDDLSRLRNRLSQLQSQFRWFPPPGELGPITVNDVWAANSTQQHCERVMQWGAAALACWREYHRDIAALCQHL